MVEKRNIRNINIMLNFLKGFACVGVVFIHVSFPGEFGELVSIVSGYAVPIFYMIAGYYAFGKNEKVIRRRLGKIIRIFVYAYLTFFIYNLVLEIKKGSLISWLAINFNWKTSIKYILFCTIDFAIPLWYLIAMIETYILWMFLVKYHKECFALKLTPFIFVLQVLLTSFCETMQYSWFWKINFITGALPWFLAGYYFHTGGGNAYQKIETFKLGIIVIVGCIITITPTILDLKIKFKCIGYIPYAIGLFCTALKHPNVSVCRPLEYIGNKLSLNIYILHPLIGNIMYILLEKFFFEKSVFGRFSSARDMNMFFLWLLPIITLIVSVVFSFIIEKAKQYINGINCLSK